MNATGPNAVWAGTSEIGARVDQHPEGQRCHRGHDRAEDDGEDHARAAQVGDRRP